MGTVNRLDFWTSLASSDVLTWVATDDVHSEPAPAQGFVEEATANHMVVRNTEELLSERSERSERWISSENTREILFFTGIRPSSHRRSIH